MYKIINRKVVVILLLRSYGVIPHAIILDTNVLVDLLAPDKYTDEQFFTLISGSNFFGEVLLPKQVLDEWNYIKDKTIEIHHNTIEKNATEIIKLIKKFPNQLGKSETEDVINNLQKLARRSYEYTYGTRKKQIDKFISNFGTIIDTRSDKLDSLVVDLAIKNFEPFFANDHGNPKNEATDALIFFGIVDFMEKHRGDYNKVVFVSFNKNEFAQKANPTKIHNNLKEFFNKVDVHFTNHLKPAFDFLELEDKEYELGKQIADSNRERENFLSDEYFILCLNQGCNNEVHINIDTILDRHEYFYVCRKCKHSWSTGDTIKDYY
jgi:predicted nucleic-acid-binding protein